MLPIGFSENSDFALTDSRSRWTPRNSLQGNFILSYAKIHASSALGHPVSQSNRDHPQRIHGGWVCGGVGCGGGLSKQLSNPTFLMVLLEVVVFFPPLSFFSQQTEQGNIFYDNRFKWKRHTDGSTPLKFRLLAASPWKHLCTHICTIREKENGKL